MQDYNEFRKAIEFTLDWETAKGKRVYSNDPKDRGGETKWGISKRSHPNLDIKNLAREQALEIYAREYWDGCGCDSIPFPLNVAVFDVAVMSGPGVAKSLARNAKSVAEFFSRRKQFLIAIAVADRSQQIYVQGWLNRTADLQKFVEINTPKEPKVVASAPAAAPSPPTPPTKPQSWRGRTDAEIAEDMSA